MLLEACLYSEIEKKTRHQKLYKVKANAVSSLSDSSVWLKHGNISVKDKARYCYLQDRNMFGAEVTLCPHCRTRPKTVDHPATQCDRMLTMTTDAGIMKWCDAFT